MAKKKPYFDDPAKSAMTWFSCAEGQFPENNQRVLVYNSDVPFFNQTMQSGKVESFSIGCARFVNYVFLFDASMLPENLQDRVKSAPIRVSLWAPLPDNIQEMQRVTAPVYVARKR